MKNILRLCGAALLFGVIAGGAMSATNIITAAMFVLDQSADTCAELTTRTDINIPVVISQPCQTDQVSVLDVLPKGNPDDFGDNGKAWIDVCDKHTSEASSLSCGRVGARSDAIEIGSRNFGGVCKPLVITINAVPFLTLGCDNYITVHKKFIVSMSGGVCDASTKGQMYFNPATSRFMGCNGGVWKFLD